MNTNASSLVEFESNRYESGYIPPLKSNSYYTIGDGQIELYCHSDSLLYYTFDMKVNSGTVEIGDGAFSIENNVHYRTMNVKSDSVLENNGEFTIDGIVDIHGTLKLDSGSTLNIKTGILYMHPGSTLIIEEGANLNIENDFFIYGTINVHLSLVEEILNHEKIYIDSSSVLIVEDINLGDRETSMTDYELALRSKMISKYTQGEYNFPNGRAGYTWKGGVPSDGSQIIQLSTLWGQMILGDFKLSILGTQKELISNLQITKNLQIKQGSTLYIAEEYNGYTYLHPELYIGVILNNCDSPGECEVDGTIVVDGRESKITIDRLASLTINEEGVVYLQNNATIHSTNNNDNAVLFINGKLVVDDISQFVGFNPSNIEFGDDGKLVVLNPPSEERRVLFTTPNRIKDSQLYELFENRLDHVEYHIQPNTGIGIDQYFDFYARDMTEWYAGMRIERAIHEGLIVWHNGGFIDLDHSIIPWANITCSLLQASRLFKTFSSYDVDKLQEAIERLRYAGCGNIVFRYIEGEEYSEVTLVLDTITMKSITNDYSTEKYVLDTDTDGELFMKNQISDTSAANIIDSEAKLVHLSEGDNYFSIP